MLIKSWFCVFWILVCLWSGLGDLRLKFFGELQILFFGDARWRLCFVFFFVHIYKKINSANQICLILYGILVCSGKMQNSKQPAFEKAIFHVVTLFRHFVLCLLITRMKLWFHRYFFRNSKAFRVVFSHKNESIECLVSIRVHNACCTIRFTALKRKFQIDQ